MSSDELPASYLAVSHVGADLIPQVTQQEMSGVANRFSQQQYTPRNREQVAAFFAGMDVVEPGLVRVEQWRPEVDSPVAEHPSFVWSGMGRKR
jgi:hypothetical protein